MPIQSLFRALRPAQADPIPSLEEMPNLSYPLAPTPRTAVLGLRLCADANVRSFPVWSPEELSAWKPEALAGRFEDLARVASQRERGLLELESLLYPLVVVTPLEGARLGEWQHERLWQWFSLPVFEQVRDAEGHLVAWECEAREGFHVAEPSRGAGFGIRIENRCACGSRGVRVMPKAWAAAEAVAR